MITQERTFTEPMLPLPYRVRVITWNVPDVYTIELVPVAESIGPWLPGQFVMTYVFGTGEVPISMSSNPADQDHIALTIRAGGYVTRAGGQLSPGDIVGIRGPFGTSWPTEDAAGSDIIVVAGGIGLAPLKSVAYTAINRRADFGKVTILYGARHPDTLLYQAELERWAATEEISSHLTVDEGNDSWDGPVGLVTKLVEQMDTPSDGTMAFVCGPDIMMRFVAEALVTRGLSPDKVYLTMERNMKCAIGLCGHCQMGSLFICYDGPVLALPRVRHLMTIEGV